jgi:hypothetical protein
MGGGCATGYLDRMHDEPAPTGHDAGASTDGDAPATEGDAAEADLSVTAFPYRGRRRNAGLAARRVSPAARLVVALAGVAVVLVVVVNVFEFDPGIPALVASPPARTATPSQAPAPPPVVVDSSSAPAPASSGPASAAPATTRSPAAAPAPTRPATPATSTTTVPAPQAVRYEAESAFIYQGRVQTNHAGYSGAGFVDMDNTWGSAVQWSVTAARAGTATLRLRYANGTAVSRPTDIVLNGRFAQRVVFPSTGSWDAWQTLTVTFTVGPGANTVRAVGATNDGGPNLDYLEVVS